MLQVISGNDCFHALDNKEYIFFYFGASWCNPCNQIAQKIMELSQKYDFEYLDDRLSLLAREVKKVVDDKAKYTDWSQRDDIKAELKVDLIILLAK